MGDIKKFDGDIEAESFGTVFNFIEDVLTVLENNGITNYNKFLSEKLNYTPAYISNLLNCTPNLTIKKITEIAFSVGHKISVKIEPIEKESIIVRTSEPMSNIVFGKNFKSIKIANGNIEFTTQQITNDSISKLEESYE